jgi:hypothetical protein
MQATGESIWTHPNNNKFTETINRWAQEKSVVNGKVFLWFLAIGSTYNYVPTCTNSG